MTDKADALPRPRLYLTGGLTALVYLAAALFYARGPEAHTRTGRELFAWFCVLTLLPLFWKGYQTVKGAEGDGARRAVVIFGAVFCLLAFLTVPFHSTDVFGYINRGWQQVHYDLNPYVARLADTPNWRADPMLREHWLYNPNPYGFLFSLLARGVCHLGGGNWWLTLALFKTVNVAAYAFTGWLVWSGARLLGHPRPLLALYVWLWNPLVLVHHIANGHNDVLVGCLVALALYLALRGALVWIIPVLVTGTLLKYGPAVVIPLALIYVWRKGGWRPVALGCLMGAALTAGAAAPYLKDWHLLKLEDIRDNATLIDNSLHSFLIHLYGTAAGLLKPLAPYRDAVNAAIKAVLRGGLVIFLLALFYRMLRNATAGSLVEKTVLAMFVLVCVASSKFNAWYMGMLLPPALLLGGGHWLRRLVILISAAELLSITFFKQAYMLNYFALILVPTLLVYRQVRREGRGADGVSEPRGT
jgi:hypothetical protein